MFCTHLKKARYNQVDLFRLRLAVTYQEQVDHYSRVWVNNTVASSRDVPTLLNLQERYPEALDDVCKQWRHCGHGSVS